MGSVYLTVGAAGSVVERALVGVRKLVDPERIVVGDPTAAKVAPDRQETQLGTGLIQRLASGRDLYCPAQCPTELLRRLLHAAGRAHDSSGATGDDPPKRGPIRPVPTEPSDLASPKLKLIDSLDTVWSYASAHAASFASRHPKTLAATVSIGLAGFAATAFGVAPMVPDAASLPKSRTAILAFC